MGRFLRWILIILIIGLIGFLIYYYSRPTPLEVRVKTVDRGVVENTVANTRAGTVNACRRTRLSPSMGGQIASLPVTEGDRVKAGTILLELWNKDIMAELKLAQSEYASAKARSEAACLQADVAEREAARLTSLRKIGAASEDQTDKAVTHAKALKADCEAARASALMSESRVGVVRANLDRTWPYHRHL